MWHDIASKDTTILTDGHQGGPEDLGQELREGFPLARIDVIEGRLTTINATLLRLEYGPPAIGQARETDLRLALRSDDPLHHPTPVAEEGAIRVLVGQWIDIAVGMAGQLAAIVQGVGIADIGRAGAQGQQGPIRLAQKAMVPQESRLTGVAGGIKIPPGAVAHAIARREERPHGSRPVDPGTGPIGVP